MTDEVPDSPVSYVGPFSEWRVLVNGRQVPFLSAHVENGGKVSLVLDDRIGLTLDLATAERVVPFLADVIAVAMGYTAHPHADWEGPIPRPPMKRVTPLFTDGEPQ